VDGVVLLQTADPVETGMLPSVLLVERGNEPFRGCWALPGGFVDYGEDLAVAVQREIAEETGLRGLPFQQFRAYGDPGRDPRGHTVSVVFVAEIVGETPAVTGGDDAARAAWFALDGLPELAFDHQQILADVLSSRSFSTP
jgi:8-oxo-dGTP diphosphatase